MRRRESRYPAELAAESAVDSEYRSLNSRRIGFDVWWKEPTWGAGPFALDHPFLELPNVVGSPHNSNRCENGLENAARAAASNVAAFLRGDRIIGVIQREDYMEQ